MHSPLLSLVAAALPRLSAIPDEIAAIKPSPEAWSAANNHQRFIRLQLEPEIGLPGYEQDGWVRLGRYQHAPWADIIALWSAYNQHLARIIATLDERALGHVWHSSDGDVTLEFIAADYVVHMRHHLQQIGIDV